MFAVTGNVSRFGAAPATMIAAKSSGLDDRTATCRILANRIVGEVSVHFKFFRQELAVM